jgi:hypothetical protein
MATTKTRHHQRDQGSVIYSTGPTRHRSCWSSQGCLTRRSFPGSSPVLVRSVASTPSPSAKSSRCTAWRCARFCICLHGRGLTVQQREQYFLRNYPHLQCSLSYTKTAWRALNPERMLKKPMLGTCRFGLMICHLRAAGCDFSSQFLAPWRLMCICMF